MNKVIIFVALVLLAGFGIALFPRNEVITVGPDTVFIKSAAIAETTTQTVTRFRTRIDSIINSDTTFFVQVDTLWLNSLDTVFINCQKCAEQLKTLNESYKLRGDTIAILNAKIASCKSKRPWYALGGLVGGAALCLGGR